MFDQKTKEKTNSLVTLICSLGIIVLLNFVSVKNFFRLDFTDEKMYTISQASKDIMNKLDDPILIKAYFTKNLPPPYNSNVRYLKDQLDDFKAYSKGKLKYEFIDPGDDKELERELMMMGIPPVQLTDIKSDKFEITRGYMGLALMFEDRKESIPLIKSTVGLEYEIISKIKKLIQKDVKKVGFLTGHGEPDINEDMRTPVTLLRDQYDVTTVDLKGGELSVPDDINTLVIAGSKERITEREKYEIDQFIMKGKTAAFLIDTVNVDIAKGNFNATPINNNLIDLIEHYGIKINSDLVLDLKNQRIQVQQRRGFMTMSNIINYPFIPVFQDIDKKNSMVMKLESLFFPFVSSLTLKENNKGNITVLSLVKSSAKSWKQSGGRFDTNPMQRFRMDTANAGPFTVAATASGEFSSFYAGKDVPAIEKKDPEAKGPIISSTDTTKTTIESSPNTRIVVVGDADFVKEAMLMDRSNLPFIMNMIDWLAQDEALISIRSRGITHRPLEEVTDFKRKLIKYTNMFGVSIIVIIFGLLRWKMRQIRKREVVL